MPENSEKLRKIKELIEKREQEADGSTRPSEKEESVDEIVKRLKQQEADKNRANRVEDKIAGLKERVGGRPEGSSESVKIGGGAMEVRAGSTAFSGGLASVGKLYNAFRGPLTSIATAMANFTPNKSLKIQLDSANINLKPEEYFIIVTTIAAVTAVVMFSLIFVLGAVLPDASLLLIAGPMALATLILAFILGLIYPSSVASERAHKIEKELPFALRQLATQVKAGVSFHKALTSIANSKYGALSDEFQRVLVDIDRGMSTDKALERLAQRTKSKGLKKTITQILRALKLGGNLSETINTIANDVSFELRMKVRDFTETLNFISIFYVLIAVVGPVFLTIFSSILQLPIFGGGLPFIVIVGGFVILAGMMGGILFIIRRLEPA